MLQYGGGCRILSLSAIGLSRGYGWDEVTRNKLDGGLNVIRVCGN